MSKRKKSTQAVDSEIRYPEITVRLFAGNDALDAAEAKNLLQWVTEDDLEVPFGNDYLLKDMDGKKVRCLLNRGNRSYSRSNADIYMQDILRGRWKLNGHSRIIGKTGTILSGQHVLTAIVLADQAWEKDPDAYPYWKTPPTIETFINFGLEEGDDIKNTIDTARPTKLSDVLYRSIYLADVPKSRKALVSRIAENAVQTVWDRTHRKSQASSRYRTHAESIAFVERHPRLMEAIRYIDAEDSSGALKLYISPGVGAGLLYLMGASATETTTDDSKGYSEIDDPGEEQINFENWDTACDFFTQLLSDSRSMLPLREHFTDKLATGTLSTKERTALLCNAWLQFSTGQALSAENFELQYSAPHNGVPKLTSNPSVGGIDCGF